MQQDLKVRFGVGVGFVDRISHWGPLYRSKSPADLTSRRQDFLPLLKQQSLIAIELTRIRDYFHSPTRPRFASVAFEIVRQMEEPLKRTGGNSYEISSPFALALCGVSPEASSYYGQVSEIILIPVTLI